MVDGQTSAPDASSTGPGSPPTLPFPVFRLSQARARYLLYDIDTVTWLRRAHGLLGVQIGGIPQFPQQNVFFGLPLELMAEEARLLVDRGLAYVVDDLEAHEGFMEGLGRGDTQAVDAVRNQRIESESLAMEKREESRRQKQEELEKIREKKGLAVRGLGTKNSGISRDADQQPNSGETMGKTPDLSETLFEPASENQAPGGMANKDELPWSVTPTTASSLMPSYSLPQSSKPVEVSNSRYAVFRQLHDRGYFMSPGLRFGCQFAAYPGDPLRFHSHFLASGADWEEEFDLLDIVGGGRLGTGVKKGYLIGGEQTEGERKGHVRTFCIEWGGL